MLRERFVLRIRLRKVAADRCGKEAALLMVGWGCFLLLLLLLSWQEQVDHVRVAPLAAAVCCHERTNWHTLLAGV